MKTASRTVRIANDLGIHLRAAGAIVQVTGRFSSEVWIENEGTKANGKSIMSVLTLAAGQGVELVITATGDDAQEAVDAVAELIESGFGAR